jgi:hypothetical protein
MNDFSDLTPEMQWKCHRAAERYTRFMVDLFKTRYAAKGSSIEIGDERNNVARPSN